MVGNVQTKPPTPTEYLLRMEKAEVQRILDYIVSTPAKPEVNYATRTSTAFPLLV